MRLGKQACRKGCRKAWSRLLNGPVTVVVEAVPLDRISRDGEWDACRQARPIDGVVEVAKIVAGNGDGSSLLEQNAA